MTRAAIAAQSHPGTLFARISQSRLMKGALLLVGLIAIGTGAANAQVTDPDDDDDPAPKYSRKYGKGPYGGYGYGGYGYGGYGYGGYGYRPAPDCHPDAAYDPRCDRGPVRRPYRGSLEERQYELGRLLGMIHPVATSCRGLTLNQRVAEAALARAEIEMGNPPAAFHTGYRLGKHLSQQMIDRSGTQYFCNQSWHRFGPAGTMWRGVLLPDPSR